MSYGTNIEKARRKAGLTQAQLGEIIGKDAGTISGYETGRFRPDIDLLVPIADATKSSLDEIMRGAPHPDAGEADAYRPVLEIISALQLTRDEVIRRLYQEPEAPSLPETVPSAPPGKPVPISGGTAAETPAPTRSRSRRA